jgi:hypothetical protein
MPLEDAPLPGMTGEARCLRRDYLIAALQDSDQTELYTHFDHVAVTLLQAPKRLNSESSSVLVVRRHSYHDTAISQVQPHYCDSSATNRQEAKPRQHSAAPSRLGGMVWLCSLAVLAVMLGLRPLLGWASQPCGKLAGVGEGYPAGDMTAVVEWSHCRQLRNYENILMIRTPLVVLVFSSGF